MVIYPNIVTGLNFSQNIYFKETCVRMLTAYLDKPNKIDYLKLRLQSLNLSSIPVGNNFHLALIQLLESKSLVHLVELDVSNTKMGDKNAKAFLTAVLNSVQLVQDKKSKKNPILGTQTTYSYDNYRCPIENINLSRNNLGFKTGAYIMSLLVQKSVKNSTKLKKIDLDYNNISLLVQNSIKKLLSETSNYQTVNTHPSQIRTGGSFDHTRKINPNVNSNKQFLYQSEIKEEENDGMNSGRENTQDVTNDLTQTRVIVNTQSDDCGNMSIEDTTSKLEDRMLRLGFSKSKRDYNAKKSERRANNAMVSKHLKLLTLKQVPGEISQWQTSIKRQQIEILKAESYLGIKQSSKLKDTIFNQPKRILDRSLKLSLCKQHQGLASILQEPECSMIMQIDMNQISPINMNNSVEQNRNSNFVDYSLFDNAGQPQVIGNSENSKRFSNINYEQIKAENKNASFEILKQNIASGYSSGEDHSEQKILQGQRLSQSARKIISPEKTYGNQVNETSHFMSPTINPMLIDNEDTSMRNRDIECRDRSTQHRNHISLTERQDQDNYKGGPLQQDEKTEFNIYNENGQVKTEYDIANKTTNQVFTQPRSNMGDSQGKSNDVYQLPTSTLGGYFDHNSTETENIKEVMRGEISRLQGLYQHYSNQYLGNDQFQSQRTIQNEFQTHQNEEGQIKMVNDYYQQDLHPYFQPSSYGQSQTGVIIQGKKSSNITNKINYQHNQQLNQFRNITQQQPYICENKMKGEQQIQTLINNKITFQEKLKKLMNDNSIKPQSKSMNTTNNSFNGIVGGGVKQEIQMLLGPHIKSSSKYRFINQNSSKLL
ncbi:UNKNOWN [Stylonychia lemnae]|uniref:Uncharacterized protein n=1 Tax=Stylonychia lemnae TaxID=5949 RepID=A0A078AM32_STYLE|nr:UNKNOWN [Stylonychia lemnae]|eukprot:CDW83430.1 UNKNOWN [Stylonychia lemnae]